jgi:hypothetical protein
MPEGAPEHGVPSTRTTRECLFSAMHDIVLPGFERVGVDVSATRNWLRSVEPA